MIVNDDVLGHHWWWLWSIDHYVWKNTHTCCKTNFIDVKSMDNESVSFSDIIIFRNTEYRNNLFMIIDLFCLPYIFSYVFQLDDDFSGSGGDCYRHKHNEYHRIGLIWFVFSVNIFSNYFRWYTLTDLIFFNCFFFWLFFLLKIIIDWLVKVWILILFFT